MKKRFDEESRIFRHQLKASTEQRVAVRQLLLIIYSTQAYSLRSDCVRCKRSSNDTALLWLLLRSNELSVESFATSFHSSRIDRLSLPVRLSLRVRALIGPFSRLPNVTKVHTFVLLQEARLSQATMSLHTSKILKVHSLECAISSPRRNRSLLPRTRRSSDGRKKFEC